jgi:hypothetical protein
MLEPCVELMENFKAWAGICVADITLPQIVSVAADIQRQIDP